MEEGLSLPVSAVNALRRQVLEELSQRRIAPPLRRQEAFVPPEKKENRKTPPAFSVSLRRFDQLTEELLEHRPAVLFSGGGLAGPRGRTGGPPAAGIRKSSGR